jgi:hypothetical protein
VVAGLNSAATLTMKSGRALVGTCATASPSRALRIRDISIFMMESHAETVKRSPFGRGIRHGAQAKVGNATDVHESERHARVAADGTVDETLHQLDVRGVVCAEHRP